MGTAIARSKGEYTSTDKPGGVGIILFGPQYM